MATSKIAVGSAAWIAAEKENVQSLLAAEKEEIIFPAEHEIEWLNEHMAGIFSKSYLDVANVFKTPGKLKGKTPRTARKRNIEPRVPLGDIFSSQPSKPSSPYKHTKGKLHFAVAQDSEDAATNQPAKSQTDSGYHGSSQVEEDTREKTPDLPAKSPLRRIDAAIPEEHETESELRANEPSFHSAKENQTVKLSTPQSPVKEDEQKSAVDHNKDADAEDVEPPNFDDIGSPSDESTPDRPLVRKKSSMTFASLPAREPMKQSMGTRVSNGAAQKRDSQLARPPSTSGPSTSHPDEEDADVEMSDNDSHIEILGVDESQIGSQAVRQYSKASTQRLHDRINALGKPPVPRPSKSIPSAMQIAALRKSEPEETKSEKVPVLEEDNDDWIKPLNNESPLKPVGGETAERSEDEFDSRAPELIAHEERMAMLSPTPAKARPALAHTKSASTATLQSPTKADMAPPASPAKSIHVSNPMTQTTTPQGSPSRFLDGVSASKSKLASIMKTAKGLFTSSASVSAAAKMETLTPRVNGDIGNDMPCMYPDLNKSLPVSPPKEIRKTRSSTEREKEEKRRQKDAELSQRAEESLEKARAEEKQKATQNRVASPQKADENRSTILTNGKPGRPGAPIRVTSKTKTQPVSIRVGTMSQRMPGNVSIATGNQDTLTGDPKRPGLTKKASTTSLQSSTSTSTSFKTSISTQPSKPKALLAAERKKEQDHREAQRKIDHKRELERRRAAQQEEARRLEQEQRAEAERKERERIAAEKTKRQAQQQAIERKRQEAARKAEQQRLEREQAARGAAQARPQSRLAQQQQPAASRNLIDHPLPTNPAKPAKRPNEEESTRLQATKYGAASQQADAKRRRTEDEHSEPAATRPTMSGAPIRQSQLGKKPSIFNHPSYQQAPSSCHLVQFPQPPPRAHPQMSQFANSKIPFAESNATATSQPAGLAKTPVSGYHARTIQTVKSSPQTAQSNHFQNGENIHLPEIPTDSEDEDSEDDAAGAFPIPDWATPGHLTEQLMRQEGIDGDAVFGPIAPLKMEEIFAKGNKERLKRLRDRTSSANWIMSGDGLTLEEVRQDRELREKMRLEGGWRYGN